MEKGTSPISVKKKRRDLSAAFDQKETFILYDKVRDRKTVAHLTPVRII